MLAKLKLLTQWIAVMVAFSVPISTALDSLLSFLLILIGIYAYRREVIVIATRNPVARAGILLFAMMVTAITYSQASLRESIGMLGKYFDLLLIPIMLAAFASKHARKNVQNVFFLAMTITLIASYLYWLGKIPPQSWMFELSNVNNPTMFRSHITQNNLMAFAIFLALLRIRESSSKFERVGLFAFVLAGTYNVFFMIIGRTGHGILMLLLVWFFWCTLTRKMAEYGKHPGLMGGGILLACGVLGSVALYHLSPRVHERVDQVTIEWKAWQRGGANETSVGLRADFYSHSLNIVRHHPLFGVGTGGFARAYAEEISGTDLPLSNNPHNEYLMMATEMGAMGLALFAYLFVTMWRSAPKLATSLEQDGARGLVLAMALNCMFNSALRDHADGLFFALMAAMFFAGLMEKNDRKSSVQ